MAVTMTSSQRSSEKTFLPQAPSQESDEDEEEEEVDEDIEDVDFLEKFRQEYARQLLHDALDTDDLEPRQTREFSTEEEFNILLSRGRAEWSLNSAQRTGYSHVPLLLLSHQ
jgi:hypothetical protein